MQVDTAKASRLINCGELILVTAAFGRERTITPCAWHMPLSRTPAIVGVCLAKGHFSSELIAKSSEFIINIPQWKHLDKVMLCGSRSGRTVDKFAFSGFSALKAQKLKATQYIKECLGCIECELVERKDIGDHYLFIGKVACAQADENYFSSDMWDTSKAELIFHLGGKYFFKSLHSPYGDATHEKELK